jgi:uncharacterized protein (TIGR00288 family)
VDPNVSPARIAVLIDADNTSHRYAEALLDEIAKYGNPTIKRAYGDWSSPRLGGWSTELNLRAIRGMHQGAFTRGKNSTDSALIIDAMDLLYDGNVEAFALVTSDSDFTSLALRLRESGKVVYGLGGAKTPASLQNACDKFIRLELLGEVESEPDQPGAEDDGAGAGPGSRPGARAQPPERDHQGRQRRRGRRGLGDTGRGRQPPEPDPPVPGPAQLRPPGAAGPARGPALPRDGRRRPDARAGQGPRCSQGGVEEEGSPDQGPDQGHGTEGHHDHPVGEEVGQQEVLTHHSCITAGTGDRAEGVGRP